VLTDGVTGSRFKVGAWFVSEDRDTAFEGSTEVENPGSERTQVRVPLITFDVRITDRLGVQAAATIPDVTRTAAIPQPTGTVNFREEFSGLGDTSVLGWYRLRSLRRWYPMVNFGLSLPTGKTETPRFRPELDNGSLVPISRLQRGTGTFDPIFGASLTRARNPWTYFASVAARTPLYENADGLRTGASAEVGGGVARYAGTHRVTVFGRLGWLHRQQDVFRGTPVLVGGGNWLYATPGVGVLVGNGINVQAEVKLPVYRSLPNKQLDSPAIFQFGVSMGF
jgi:hypothetical protein